GRARDGGPDPPRQAIGTAATRRGPAVDALPPGALPPRDRGDGAPRPVRPIRRGAALRLPEVGDPRSARGTRDRFLRLDGGWRARRRVPGRIAPRLRGARAPRDRAGRHACRAVRW